MYNSLDTQSLAGVRMGSSSNQQKLMTEDISEWTMSVVSCSQRKHLFSLRKYER